MPRAWSTKDEKQYEHVRRSEIQRGRTAKRAREIAARTVNKQRRLEGRAEAPYSRATGAPTVALERRSRAELYNRARELHVRGRGRMRKAELVRAIRSAA